TTWLDGKVWADCLHRDRRSMASLGRLLGRLDRSLAGFHHAAAEQPYPWDLAGAAGLRDAVALIGDPERRAAAGAVLAHLAGEVEPRLRDRLKQVIHGDANDRNLLLDETGAVSGLLDFGDMVESWRVNELAVAAAYASIDAADPVAQIAPLIQAY